VIQQQLALLIEQVTRALSCCGSLSAPVPRLFFLPLLAMTLSRHSVLRRSIDT